jgi:hypothetical protein
MTQQPHGQRAQDYLRMRLPIGSQVDLDVKTTDRYGRTVAEVIGQINIGLPLVEDGQAFAYRQSLSGCDAREYLDAEYRASHRRHGVWQVSGGISGPWDFRRSPPGPAFLKAPHPADAVIGAARSASMAAPSSCCVRATRIWMEMGMGRPVNPSAAEGGRHSPHHSPGDRNSKR